MTFAYSQTAKQRIAQQGAPSIAAFLEEVPLAVRQRIVKALPTIPGFRKNSAPEFKKKCERLVGAIAHAPDEKFRASTAEWNVFGGIWASWGYEKFHEAFPKGPHSFADISQEGALEFLRQLVEAEKSGCAREDVERLVLFSGLPTSDVISAFVGALPLRAALERDRALAKLPEDVATLQRKVSDIGRNTEKLAQDVRAVMTDASAAANTAQRAFDAMEDAQRKLSELPRPTSGPSLSEVAALSEQIAAQTKHFDSRLKKSLDAWQASESDLHSKYASLQKSVSSLASEIVSIKSSISATNECYQTLVQAQTTSPDIASTPNDESMAPALEIGPRPIAGMVKWFETPSRKESERFDRLETIFQSTHENLVAAGVRQTDADGVARTIVAATLAGQLIQFCGSLADVLGVAAATCVGSGKTLLWQVPLGLCDGNDVEALLRKASGAAPKAQALLLRGANRSAFEIYGSGIRDVVLERQFSRNVAANRQMTFIATWAEGPATLPGGATLIELGPVVDSDELAWSSSVDWGKQKHGEFVFDDRSVGEFQSTFGDEISEALLLVDALELPRNRFWRMAFSRYISILFALPGSTYGSSLSVALSTWVLPWAKSKGVTRDKLEGAIKACASEQLKVESVRSALKESLAEVAA